jgi:hypothetical protein
MPKKSTEVYAALGAMFLFLLPGVVLSIVHFFDSVAIALFMVPYFMVMFFVVLGGIIALSCDNYMLNKKSLFQRLLTCNMALLLLLIINYIDPYSGIAQLLITGLLMLAVCTAIPAVFLFGHYVFGITREKYALTSQLQ